MLARFWTNEPRRLIVVVTNVVSAHWQTVTAAMPRAPLRARQQPRQGQGEPVSQRIPIGWTTVS
jgi:hypothetical protein